MRTPLLALTALVGSVLGCPGPSNFLCSADDQCQTAEALGTCQPSGNCSFDEPSCASGQRYGDHSGELSGDCVEPTTQTDGAGMSTDTATISESTTGSGSTAAVDDNMSTSGGMTTATPLTGSSSDDATDSSSGPPDDCVVVWEDDFNDGAIDPGWAVLVGLGMTVQEVGAQLRFSLNPAVPAYSSLDQLFGPMDSHRYWAHLSELLSRDSAATLDTCVVSDEGSREFCFYSDATEHVAATVDMGASTTVGMTPTDFNTNAFVAITFAGPDVSWEVSGDGDNWIEVHRERHSLPAGTQMFVQLGGGTFDVAALPPDAAVAADAVGVCKL